MEGVSRSEVAEVQGCSVPLRSDPLPLLRSDFGLHSATLRSLAPPPSFALPLPPCSTPPLTRLHL